MTKDRVVAFRDPQGVRPLALGKLAPADRRADARATASPASPARSTSSAARYLREVEPGEIVTLGEGGLESRMAVRRRARAFCVFEYIYFARRTRA